MYSKHLLSIAFTFCLGIVCSQNWTGNLNSDWNNPSNWSAAPSNGSDLTIDPSFYTGASASPIIATNSNFSPGAILITNGGDLTISANLTTSDDVEVLGIGSNITVTNGTFTVNVGNGGRLVLDLEATMTVDAGSVIVGERFIAGIDALVTINGGSISSGERLIMDGGGRFIQNGGTVSVAATFAMADGSPNYNSSYILNDGNLSITGEMGFENEAGNFEPTFEQFDGTLTLNGDMFWFGEAPGLGTPKCLLHGGISSINGTIENLPLSTVSMYFKIDQDAYVVFNGPRWETIGAQDSVIMLGNSILRVTNTNSIINEGVWYGAENAVTMFSGVTTLIGNGSFQFHHLFINGLTPPNSLNHTTTSPLKISGDFSNINTFIPNSNQVVFNGSSSQVFTSQYPLQFHHLEINNTSSTGVEIITGTNTTYSIAGHLELTDGLLYVGTFETLKLLDNATASNGDANSYVHGALTKIGDDAFTFPVGKNEKWGAIAISAPASITSEFKAEYFDNSHPTPTPVNTPITSISGVEYWQLDQTVGTDNVTVQLFWDNALESLIADCNELSMVHWNGGSWDNVLGTSSGSCVAQDPGAIISNASLSTYGAFTFGFYSGVTSQTISLCSGEFLTVGTNTYNTSGTYLDILQDQSSQDSIVITNLTIVEPIANISHTNEVLNAGTNGDSYQWINCGGTSIIGEDQTTFTPTSSGNYALVATLNTCVDTSDCVFYTIVDTTICNGTTYTVGTDNYSLAGTYANLLISSSLNDSLIVSNLTVEIPNSNVTVSGIVITAVNTNSQYQWLDCTNSFNQIDGETSQSFTPTLNGFYALEVTENGCIDTSNCIVINAVGLQDLENLEISIFPNPVNDYITVKWNNSIQLTSLRILNSLGSEVQKIDLMPQKNHISVPFVFPSGVYFVEIASQNGSQTKKFIKL